MKKRTIRKTGKAVVSLLVVLAVLFAAGFIAYFSHGFTGGLVTFYVRCGPTDYMKDTSGAVFARDEALRFDVQYTFGFLNPKGDRSFTVKVVPGEADFDFTIDGKLAAFGAEKDLTAGFDLVKDATGFTLTWPRGRDLAEILGAVYPDHVIAGVPDYRELYRADYFALLIGSADGSKRLRIGFRSAPEVTGIEIGVPELML